MRTLDDSLITVKLMVIYELRDIETMLNKTQDPISDFANAICADVISRVAKLTFAEFLAHSANQLNMLGSYAQLAQRAARNGYSIESIIYNGYISSPEMQVIQDSAIQSRTQFRLNSEIEKQRNELIDLKLHSESKRLGVETDFNRLKFEFEQKILDMNKRFELEKSRLEHEHELRLSELALGSTNEIKKRELEIDEAYLVRLNELNVNVNKYQIELAESKNKIDKLYQLVN